MKTHEIIKGAYFMHKGELVQASPSINAGKAVYYRKGGHGVTSVDELKPIPITKEWLKRLGFSYNGSYYNDILKIYLHKEGAADVSLCDCSEPYEYFVHYIHELQMAGVFFGKELIEIK